jgi:hypothetical protein
MMFGWFVDFMIAISAYTLSSARLFARDALLSTFVAKVWPEPTASVTNLATKLPRMRSVRWAAQSFPSPPPSRQ